MDNPHQQITGYRDLSPEEIALINECKALAERVGTFVERLNRVDVFGVQPDDDTEKFTDLRWVLIGKTHLQQGFMALTRAIARPESF